METKREELIVLMPSKTTMGVVILNLSKTIINLERELADWEVIYHGEKELYDGRVCYDTAFWLKRCLEDLEAHKKTLKWAKDFQAACLSLYSNLPVENTKNE